MLSWNFPPKVKEIGDIYKKMKKKLPNPKQILGRNGF
jgi:hypothetical protein